MNEEEDCNCEFDIDPTEPGEEAWHFKRKCICGNIWFSLHCPHDGYQNPCPLCGHRNRLNDIRRG